MNVTHIELTDAWPVLRSTYLEAHLPSAECPEMNLAVLPPDYVVLSSRPLHIHVYHGRFDPALDMDDWGFTGPTFQCGNMAHTPPVILLQECDGQSLELARRLGLTVQHDTIGIAYSDDMLLIPRFKDAQPAYFGDFTLERIK